MSYNLFKKKRRQVKLQNITDYDLYFEEIPPAKAYKLRRAINRNLRKLKTA